MLKVLKSKYYMMGAMVTMGTIGASEQASATGSTAGGNNFGSIAENITTSVSNLPGLLSALSYLLGLVLGVMGIMKIKDHVEKPDQTPLREGAVRLVAGGALFALPIVFEAMSSTLGQGDSASASQLNKVTFGVAN